MISGSTVFAFIIAAVSTLILPVLLLVILGVKKKISIVPFIMGVTAFSISQIFLRIPLLNTLSTQGWYQDLTTEYIPYILFLSISAGLFEESARLGGALLLKKNRSYKDMISFGLGHAFCEVILLIGATHINNIVLCLAINNPGGALAATIPLDTLNVVTAQLTAVVPYQVYLGILERVSAVLFHIFATVLVFKGVIQKKWRYYAYAIIAHMLFNLIGILLSGYAGLIIAEAALLVAALAGGMYTLKQREWAVNEWKTRENA